MDIAPESNVVTDDRRSGPASEARAPHWRLWGTTLWGFLIIIVFLLSQTFTVFSFLLSRNDPQSESQLIQLYLSAAQDGYVLSVATLITTVVCCGLIAGIVKLKRGSVLTDYLAICRIPLRTMLQWLGFLAAFIVVSDVLTVSLGRSVVPEFMSDVYATAQPVWLLWLALLVAAPLFEEAFFRGFLFRGFETSVLGTVGTVLVTAALWAMMHLQYDLYGMATIFGLGLLLGAARARTGSLLVPLGLHSVANLIATVETAVTA